MTIHRIVPVALFGATLSAAASFSTLGCNGLIGIEDVTYDETQDPDLTPAEPWPSAYVSGNTCGADTVIIDDSLIQGCLNRISCDPLVAPYTISQCVTLSPQTEIRSEFCGFRAETCSTIAGCYNRAFVPDSRCDGKPEGWSCEDDTAYFCGQVPFALDCAALGAECSDNEGSEEGAMGPCQVPDLVVDCTGKEDGEFYCEDDVLYTCEDDVAYSEDCDARSLECNELRAGEASCGEDITSCSEIGEVTCDDDNVRACSQDGTLSTFDCSTASLSCKQDGAGVAYCLADGCDIDSNCFESCGDNAETLFFCQGATQLELDCSDYGYNGCIELQGSSGTMARCVGGGGPIPLDDTCQYSNDGSCDEPIFCTVGTDDSDCASARGTCGEGGEWENDGSCDVPLNCPYGSDVYDCVGVPPQELCCFDENPCEIGDADGDENCDCPSMDWDAAACGG